MATQVRVSLQEYLGTTYRPDREYVDGEVRERNVGKWEHARLQAMLAAWFARHEAEWNVMVSTEQRMQVSAERVRIPDLVVVQSEPQPDIIQQPPLLVIEILSPDDTYSDIEERVADYRSMGVKTIWTIDPKSRTGRMCMGDDWKSARRLEVPGTAIFAELDELFSYLNRPRP
ncbi:MAG TPA: Uma2 family endonuclease [Acidobacteriaceae bacterium]|nr:Uma2 family endonuclease [Acidobacteriaceae bacterium]